MQHGKKLDEGTLVKFEVSPTIYGKGVICGVAQIPVAVLGYTYIVRYTELSVPYEYSTISVFENMIKEEK